MSNIKSFKVKLVRRMSGRKPGHMECARGLGLRRLHHVVECVNTPENRGMIKKVSYMLEVEEVS